MIYTQMYQFISNEGAESALKNLNEMTDANNSRSGNVTKKTNKKQT